MAALPSGDQIVKLKGLVFKMSRNSMNHFSVNPQVNISRSRFDLDSTVKFTGNTGKLIPFYLMEVLPGDTFEVKTSMVARLQTLIHPIMDNLYLDTYYFFVPNRLVWDHWQQFCGEPNKAWTPDVEYTIPQMYIDLNDDAYKVDGEFSIEKFSECFKDSIIDYMGLGFNAQIVPEWFTTGRYEFSALPVRCYNKIYDDWFRDENLIDPVNLYTGDLDDKWIYNEEVHGGKCYKAAKLHDYFTSALPQAQRGNPVELTVGNNVSQIPVYTGSTSHDDTFPGDTRTTLKVAPNNNVRVVDGNVVSSLSSEGSPFIPRNLYGDLRDFGLGITINDLRLAFQVQKFMEKSARGGARYIELLKEMFGVTSPDSRLQRSEYLGGHRIPINIHQIVNQTETIDSPLGNTGAMSLTSDVHNDFIHSFVEHGYVIGICVARYKHSYSQGFNKLWSRKTKFDFYWPVFANIGEQPIRNKELYVCGEKDDNNVFGYQEAWAEYRYIPDRVAGEMRPGIPNTLASWHLGDYYNFVPYLDKDWIEEDLYNVDRCLAVTSSVADQFLFDFYIQNKATRPMPVYSIPGLADHH